MTDGVKTECNPCTPQQWVIDAPVGDVNGRENVGALDSSPSSAGFLVAHLGERNAADYLAKDQHSFWREWSLQATESRISFKIVGQKPKYLVSLNHSLYLKRL